MRARWLCLLLVTLSVGAPLAADRQHVVFDDTIDFRGLGRFAVAAGRATTTRPELNNTLILQSVESAIRAQLTARGLQDTPSGADVLVSFSVGQDRPNGPSVTFDEGVLVIQVTRRDTSTLIWHGTWRDDSSTPGKFAERLPSLVKKLLSAYPPKKK